MEVHDVTAAQARSLLKACAAIGNDSIACVMVRDPDSENCYDDEETLCYIGLYQDDFDGWTEEEILEGLQDYESLQLWYDPEKVNVYLKLEVTL